MSGAEAAVLEMYTASQCHCVTIDTEINDSPPIIIIIRGDDDDDDGDAAEEMKVRLTVANTVCLCRTMHSSLVLPCHVHPVLPELQQYTVSLVTDAVRVRGEGSWHVTVPPTLCHVLKMCF